MPINPTPKANPYNPKVKKVVEVPRKFTSKGWKETFIFDDGTKSTRVVKGQIVVDGQVYHGKVLMQQLIPDENVPWDPGFGCQPAERLTLYDVAVEKGFFFPPQW